MNNADKRKALELYCREISDCSECVFFKKCLDNGGIYNCHISDRDVNESYKILTNKNRESKPDYWSNICKMQKKQTEKGIKTYGQPLEDNKSMTIFDRLEYLEEELIDGLMYIEHIKEKLYQFRDLLNEEAG